MSITKEQLEQISKDINTQDNRCTSHPMFVVKQRRRIYGMDSRYAEDGVWQDEDGCDVHDEDEIAKLEEALDAGADTDGYEFVYYRDVHEFVTACFTQKAADAYIERHRHNLKDPFVYVDSGYGNEEWIFIRNWLKGLTNDK